MPAVKPPEWDAMSAREQLLWYLERLCAQADEMSSVLGIASAGAPPVVTPLDPAASTTTHASSAPVPDVSGSTTKAQEVLEVSHDASPACIAMAQVTCSTECSHQVATTDIVSEVRDATVTIFLVPAVNLQPAPTTVEEVNDSNTATAICLDLTIDLNTTTALGPKPVVNLCNTTAAIEVGTCGHGDKFGALNIPVMVSISPLLHVQVPSPKSIPDSTRRVDVGRPVEYALVAATRDVAIELAVLPGISSFINKAHATSDVLHGASLGCITMAPWTCSAECLNQDNGTLGFSPQITTVSLLPAATPTLVTDIDHSSIVTVDSMQPSQNHDLDVSPPTRHEGPLMLRPTPWPSFWLDLADGSDVRPIPWPSFSCSHAGMNLNHKGLLPQVTDAMKCLPGNLNSLRVSSRYFPSVPLKPCPYEHHVLALEYAVVGAIPIPDEMQKTIQIMSMEASFQIGRVLEHLFLLAQVYGSGLIGSTFPVTGGLGCNFHGYCIRILHVQLCCWGSLQHDTDNSCFSKHLLHEGKHWFLELCACSITSVPVLQHSWLATMAALLCRRMRKMGVGNIGHSSSIGLHLIQFEQLPPFATASITDQRQLNYDKHAAVCNIPRHEKSQGAMQIRSMLVIRSFLSQRGFQGNVYMSKSALQDLNAAQSVVLITRLLTNMSCCIIILGSGDISWYLHQMILSTLKHSVKCTQAKLPNTYTYSVFNLQLSTFWAETACRSSMLFIFSEPLLHIHSVLLLLPWPPPHGAHGLQSADFFTREFSCPFGTLVLPCFPSEQISCEADHSCWYLALLKSLVAQTIQNAAEACDSKSSMFASVVLLFGHKKSMSKDLNFLHLKGSSSGLLFMASNIASIVCVIHWNKSCKEFSPNNHNQDGLACEPWFKSELAAIVSIYGLRWCVASLIASLDEGLLGSISQPELGLVQFEAQKLEYILGITTVGLQSLAAIYVQIQLGACTKDGRKRALLQEEKNVSLLVSNGFYVAYFHKTKKLISLLRAFCESSYELQLVPCLCVGISHELVLMCYCRATQQSTQCDDGDGMATRTRCVVLIQGIDTPWDPGGITHELEKGRHWLEGKPVFKEGGVSAALYPGWATGHLSWANRHGLSPTGRSRARPLHILEGEERAKVSSGSRTRRRRHSSSSSRFLLPVSHLVPACNQG